MKKKLAMFICVLMICLSVLTGCGGTDKTDTAAVPLGFSDAVDIEELKKLDGKTIEITGYMATLSPISGKYMYLMNMPYQSCPFCVPNTTQLSNTMAVYAADGSTFEFTDRAILVKGTLKVEDYTDEYGYEYNYRIVDATYSDVDLSTVSSTYVLWQSIASDGIVAEVNSMFDYLYFVSQWTDYTITYVDDNGDTVQANMYPGDVYQFLELEGPNGYLTESSESYFEDLKSRARAISADELEDLCEIIDKAAEVREHAMNELNNGNYTYDEENDSFTLNNGEQLYNEWYDVYCEFSAWLGKWTF